MSEHGFGGHPFRQVSLKDKGFSDLGVISPTDSPISERNPPDKLPRLMPVLTASPEAEARAFDKFVSPEPNTGCWLWTGGCDKDGYGLMRFSVGRRATATPAHRAMWQFRNGTMSAEHEACHSCDTPTCVNPDHVWPGTSMQNKIDCIKKGRARYRPRFPGHLCTKYASVADAEAAASDPSIPVEQARRLLERVYRRRDPVWREARLARFEADRADIPPLPTMEAGR